MADLQNLLNSSEAAAYLNLQGGRRGMEFMRTKGKGPKFIKLSGKAIRYRLEDLQAWIEKHEITPIKEATE